jgi:hypothetical protein
VEHLRYDAVNGAESAHAGIPALLFVQHHLPADVHHHRPHRVQDFPKNGVRNGGSGGVIVEGKKVRFVWDAEQDMVDKWDVSQKIE